MEKIIVLIYKEARRRPGKRLVPKLNQVLTETVEMTFHLMDELIEAEEGLQPHKFLQNGDLNSASIKRP